MELTATLATAVAALGAVAAAGAAWLSARALKRNAEFERTERQFQRVDDALVELRLTATRAIKGVVTAPIEAEPAPKPCTPPLALAPVRLDQCELMARNVPAFQDVVNQSEAAFEELAREWLRATGREPPPGRLLR